MRAHAVVLSFALLAFAGCSSSSSKDATPREPTESERELEALLAEGARLNGKGQFREAADRFKSAVVIDPKNLHAQYDLAVALENAKEWKASADAYERVVQLAPKLAAAHHHLGEVRLALGDRAAARKELEAATTLDPRAAESWIALGRVEVEDGHPEVAAKRLEKAALTVDEPDVWFHLGFARELAKDEKGARAAYEHTIKMDPRHTRALNNLGRLHAVAKDVDGAIELWRQAVAVDPRFVAAQKNLGVALHRDRSASYLALPHLRAYVELGGDDAQVKAWATEIHEATKTFRNADRASAVFDRIDKGELVTADLRFPLRDAAVAEKAKTFHKGDKVMLFFESPTGTKVTELRLAK